MKIPLDSIVEDLNSLDFAILELLKSDNRSRVEGNIVFQKEMFLIGNFIEKVGEKAEFIPHAFGPYSEASEICLNDLVSLGLVKTVGNNKYEITDVGTQALDRIQNKFSKEELESIADFKKFLGKLSVDEILLFIYASYPKYTIESTEYKRIIKSRLKIAYSIYKKGQVSLEKAAFLAGLNIESFLNFLKRYQNENI